MPSWTRRARRGSWLASTTGLTSTPAKCSDSASARWCGPAATNHRVTRVGGQSWRRDVPRRPVLLARDAGYQRCRILRRSIARPDDILVGTHQNQARLVLLAAAAMSVANYFQRHFALARGLVKYAHRAIIGVEREQREAVAQLLEHAATAAEFLRREVVPGL